MKDIVYSKIKAGLYAIEPDGHIFSYSSKKYMKTSIDKDGYVTISLRNSFGGYSHFGIHRLLMITYHPVDNMENLTVNHIDGNKTNNTLSNLEWMTSSENTKEAYKTGLTNNTGEHHGKAKITDDDARKIIELLKQGYGTKIIKRYIPNANKKIVYNIKHNIQWKHIPR